MIIGADFKSPVNPQTGSAQDDEGKCGIMMKTLKEL
jgi:hypothetical protein